MKRWKKRLKMKSLKMNHSCFLLIVEIKQPQIGLALTLA
jgi:hypothetical protein